MHNVTSLPLQTIYLKLVYIYVYIYISFIYISELGNGYMLFSQDNVSKKQEIYSDENNFSSPDGIKGSLKGNKIFFHVCLEIY